MNRRVWELDALRGLALLGMLAVHLVYDLVDLFGVFAWREPGWYLFVKNRCGFLFLVISGVSATLGSRCLRRGVQVFACGLLCTAVTGLMYLLGFSHRGIVIWFGALHCLGLCMVLWHWLRRLPGWSVTALGAALTVLGLFLERMPLDAHWALIPLGLCPAWFSSSDYFPLLPNLGFFLLGTSLGRAVYREKQTRLPGISPQRQPIRLLCAMGRQSLPIYLLHQPVLAGFALLLSRLVPSG